MTASWYERMTGADRSFLVFEGRHTHMNVGGTTIFEAGPLRTPEGGIDSERIRAYIGSRLHLIPRYRQRLAYAPIEGYPVWVDDDRLNLHYHVRHACLPRPGNERQLQALAAQIMSQRLDRRRPLWEAWLIEGLADERFAMVLKTHHCVVDGVSGVDLMSVLLRSAPDDAFEPAPEWRPRPTPAPAELLRGELWRHATRPFALGRQVVAACADPFRLPARLAEGVASAAGFVRSGLRPPAATPINQPIGPFRRCDWMAMSLAEVKQVKNALGATVNDVILATAAGALRRYLMHRETDVRTLDVRVVVPVSVRAATDAGTMGNRVAAWLLSLPIQEADPRARCAELTRTTAGLKASHQARGVEVLAQVAELFDPIMTLGVRLARRLHPYNLIISNVPGPQFPLYLLGARLRAGYPIVPLFESQGFGIATFSYDGTLFWGLNACWDLIPDLDVFVAALETSFQELREAALGGPAQTIRERTAAPGARAATASSMSGRG